MPLKAREVLSLIHVLHDPAELSCLVVGSLPGAGMKLGLCYRGILILSAGVGFGEKLPREGRCPVLRNHAARAG